MKPARLLLHSTIVCLAGLLSAAAAEDAPFALITKRNIFDPTRRPDVPRVVREAPAPPPASPRSETILLTGSLVSPQRRIAFFSGSDPSYNAIRSPDDPIGEFTVGDITTTQVVLDQGETQLVLPVGHQLQRIGDEPWTVQVRTGVPSAAPVSTSSPSTPAASQDMSDVMKRLLERRQKELSK